MRLKVKWMRIQITMKRFKVINVTFHITSMRIEVIIMKPVTFVRVIKWKSKQWVPVFKMMIKAQIRDFYLEIIGNRVNVMI